MTSATAAASTAATTSSAVSTLRHYNLISSGAIENDNPKAAMLSGFRDILCGLQRVEIPRPKCTGMEFIATRGRYGFYQSVKRSGAEKYGISIKNPQRRPGLPEPWRQPQQQPTQAEESTCVSELDSNRGEDDTVDNKEFIERLRSYADEDAKNNNKNGHNDANNKASIDRSLLRLKLHNGNPVDRRSTIPEEPEEELVSANESEKQAETILSADSDTVLSERASPDPSLLSQLITKC